MDWYKYTILKVCPDDMRGEVVNIGLAVIHPTGQSEIHLAPNFTKVKALNGNVTDELLRELVEQIDFVSAMSNDPEQKQQLIRMACTGVLRCSPFGEFALDAETKLSKKVQNLLSLLVEPVRRTRSVQHHRIETRLKTMFEARDLLGGKDDIENHLVVPNFMIDEKLGFKADFAFKNGVYHVTQTIDLDTSDATQKHAQAALDALTLDKARDVLGENTKRYVVYSMSSVRNQLMEPHLNLLRDHASEMFNLRSQQETKNYFELLETARASTN